ncbi:MULTISPECIES: methionine ABC transporter permease [Bartonella]|uniref:methionine ABC transporter permease n=1 Tax=Bartonella TaxID=773 RepID=UPI0018DD2480|nr:MULTISPECIES: methionine ABC transporter permease [Bartonella]MBH9995803.1 ABC transporter permease [Bartonella sp. P0291]MBH9997964.1 ABC transporter permease [Bartonella sp. M0192]MBI0000170.1 ABC transporter permease [Bartonella sp. M0191]MBI0008476.1 ABC transporter permease [Bartonella sp. M0193]MBI0011461.1 ABC transporter permease [Bartonella sp. M0176]
MYDVLSKELPKAIIDTIIMTVSSSLMALILGLPIGLILYMTAKGSLFPKENLNRLLSFLVNCVRAIPFIIFAFYLLPVTRIVVGTGVGIRSVIFVLILSATPLYARLAELSFRGVDKGLVEAIRSMGASRMQIVTNVIVPESFSSLVTGFTVMVISIISATSLAGFLGGGGLGDMAIRYGYQRYNPEIMNIVIGVLIVMNLVVQSCGDRLARKLDHSKR